VLSTRFRCSRHFSTHGLAVRSMKRVVGRHRHDSCVFTWYEDSSAALSGSLSNETVGACPTMWLVVERYVCIFGCCCCRCRCRCRFVCESNDPEHRVGSRIEDQRSELRSNSGGICVLLRGWMSGAEAGEFHVKREPSALLSMEVVVATRRIVDDEYSRF